MTPGVPPSVATTTLDNIVGDTALEGATEGGAQIMAATTDDVPSLAKTGTSEAHLIWLGPFCPGYVELRNKSKPCLKHVSS